MSKSSLNLKLSFIGVQIAGGRALQSKNIWIDIEKTIYEASIEIQKDSRILSLLCSWILVHGNRVIIEKLMRFQKKENSPWLVAVAIFAVNNGFCRWERLIKKQKQEIFIIDRELALSSIGLKGEEDGMRKQNFLIPKGAIRARERDALSVRELARINLQYRNRLIFGAAIRSDIITAIEFGFETPYAIAKAVGCSYEPAHRIFNEYQLHKSLKIS